MPNSFDANDSGPSNARLFLDGLGLLAIVAMLVVASVASEVLARAVLGSRDGSSEDHSDRR